MAVVLRGVSKSFGSGETCVTALAGIDLSVARGEFISVMGPSGSGKSTLLHLIGALDAPTSGTIFVGEDNLVTLDDDRLTLLRRRRIGLVFQAFNLIDVLTAEENVALPLELDGQARAHSRAEEALELVGLARRRAHLAGQLSGGEQQRVAIARAIVTNPLVLLADEPTGNLDSGHGDQVMTLLRSLADDQGQTIIMVTHDAGHAALSDRLIHLRDGRIAEEQSLVAPGKPSRTTTLADDTWTAPEPTS
jgi:putative ABC transport system ATP-binding protein